MAPVKIGIVGCGDISAAYLQTAQAFPILACVACADSEIERARSRAAEFGVPRACTPEELLSDPDVEIVVNLTPPRTHFSVSQGALSLGKHVYSEKPLALSREEGRALLALAKEKGLRVGCAPGTFLGAGLQTCRKLIDEGAIGQPVAALAFMLCRGPEHRHPDPQSCYEWGGGPMLDRGPYFLTALMNLFGPIRRVSGSASILIPDRVIASAARQGEPIVVETPDHIAGTVDFTGGAIATLVTSFAALHGDDFRPITVFGTVGTLAVPDPDTLGGPVRLRRAADTDWTDAPLTHTHGDLPHCWGIGLVDMAHALRSGRPHRASGQQALHVLDAMLGFFEASNGGVAHNVSVEYRRPAPLPTGLPENALDA